LKIMFPLVSGIDDFLSCKDLAFEVMRELDKEKLVYNDSPAFGAMVELPSAVAVVDELAEEADFLSIGSNDLVQYMLGVDRTNRNVADLYSVFHPAVLRAIKSIASAADAAGCPVSVCGDAVGEEAMMAFFLGVGINSFSVDPRLLTKVRARISGIDTEEAASVAEKMLSFRTLLEVKAFLESKAGLMIGTAGQTAG